VEQAIRLANDSEAACLRLCSARDLARALCGRKRIESGI